MEAYLDGVLALNRAKPQRSTLMLVGDGNGMLRCLTSPENFRRENNSDTKMRHVLSRRLYEIG